MPIQEKKYKEYLSQEYEPVDESAMPYQQGRCYSFSFRRGEAAVYDS